MCCCRFLNVWDVVENKTRKTFLGDVFDWTNWIPAREDDYDYDYDYDYDWWSLSSTFLSKMDTITKSGFLSWFKQPNSVSYFLQCILVFSNASFHFPLMLDIYWTSLLFRDFWKSTCYTFKPGCPWFDFFNNYTDTSPPKKRNWYVIPWSLIPSKLGNCFSFPISDIFWKSKKHRFKQSFRGFLLDDDSLLP